MPHAVNLTNLYFDAQFPTQEKTNVSPRANTTLYTQAISFMTVTDAAVYLQNTLDQALAVSVQVAQGSVPIDGQGKPTNWPSEDQWVDKGVAVNVAAGAQVALDADDLPKLVRAYPWIRLKLVPAGVPTAGSLSGQMYREWD